MRTALWFLAFALLGAVACTPADSEEEVWGPCPQSLQQSAPEVFGSLNPQCATLQVPLRWDEPQGPQIEVGAVRILNPRPQGGELWLLDGGPGGQGLSYLRGARQYLSTGLDLIIPVHRGAGISTPLDCGVSHEGLRDAAEVARCVENLQTRWGHEGLSGFSAREAGRDLAHQIDALSQSSPIHVYGASYGSHWALRYLQAAPEQASGVILDGVLDFEAEVWLGSGMANQSAMTLLDACQQDSACREAFDGDVFFAMNKALEGLRSATCRVTFTRQEVSTLMATHLARHDPTSRNRALTILEALYRCDTKALETIADDIEALQFKAWGPGTEGLNAALYVAVVGNDFIGHLDAFPHEEVEWMEREMLFSTGTPFFAHLHRAWTPSGTPAADHHTLPDTDLPVLILTGALDMQTVPFWASRAARHFDGPNQRSVIFPQGGHVSVGTTPTPTGDCGLRLLKDFVGSPETLDTACVSRTPRRLRP